MYVEISKKNSIYIKGIAIIMMVYHHFFGFQDRILIQDAYWAISVKGYSVEELLAKACKLCVCIFTFLSGYGMGCVYQKKEKKDMLPYTMRRIFKILCTYWGVLLLFFCPLVIVYDPGRLKIGEILENIFLVDTNCLHTSWYVAFYIEAIILLFVYVRFIKKNLLTDFVLMLFPVIAINWLVGENTFSHYYPVFILGYIFAGHKLYSWIYSTCRQNIKLYGSIMAVLLGGVFLLRIEFGDMLGPISTITIMSVPLLGVLNLVVEGLAKIQPIRAVLQFLGEYSLYYWLIHSLFHCGIKEMQSIVYLPYLDIVIIMWAFLLMTPLAMALNKLVKCLCR